jgi:hypothetical protein
MGLLAAARYVYARTGMRALLPMSAKVALRRPWARAAYRLGHPLASPLFSMPPLPPDRRPPRLVAALLASDLNPRYVECWPLAQRAWREILDVEATLVLVCRGEDAPAGLLGDPAVRLFEPLPGVPTSLQAQCIRLLYPALLDTDGAVILSDMELVPLSARYFRAPLAHLDERMFVAYRDVVFSKRQMAIAYNAARPETWAAIFGISSEADVRERLFEWTLSLTYDGVRGGAGWYTDQKLLFSALERWPERGERLWVFDDAYTGFRRLDRHDLDGRGPTRRQLSAVRRGRYADFDSLVPYSEFASVNDQVLRAVGARGEHS